MMLNDYNIGMHSPFSGKIANTLLYVLSSGSSATQFFMGSPQSFKRAVIEEKDISDCLSILERFPINVFTHFPYVVNLCGSKDCLAWQDKVENKVENDVKEKVKNQNSKTMIALKGLEYEINTIAKLKGGVVIHPGSFKDREKGLLCIAKSINKINFSKDGLLLLENSAGQGDSLATTLKEIQTIIENVEEKKRNNIGVCIDTCHLFAYGEYDISKASEITRFFKDFDTIIGLKKLKLIHLNDSETVLKSKKDRHASIGKGYIWGNDKSSLIELVLVCKREKIPMVLETGTNDIPFILNMMENLIPF